MKFTKYLSKIPINKLVEFIGEDVVYGLQEYEIASSTKEMAEILRAFKGYDVFRTKGLVKSLLWSFSESDLDLLNGLTANAIIVDYEDFRMTLLNKSWGNNSFSKGILSFFNIDDIEYVSQPKHQDVDSETVIPRLSTKEKTFNGYEIFTPEMYPLHPFQKSTKDKIIDLMLKPSSRFILHMPTGSGKTKTAVESIIDFWRVKGKRSGFIVWFAHSKELCEQAYETFKTTWAAKGDYPIGMYKIFEDNIPDLSLIENGILFVGFQKFNGLINRNHHSALKIKNTTRLVVVDEAHKSVATTYRNAISYVLSPDTRLMGLTATPGRSSDIEDPQNAHLSSFYHNNKIKILDENGVELSEAIKYLQQHQYLAKLKRVKVESDFTISAEEQSAESDVSESALARMSTNDNRNSKILKEIEKAVVERKHPTLVFSTSVAHAMILKILLQRKGIEAECVLGNTPSKLRSDYIRSFKSGKLLVLINFGVLTTGFDAPNIRTLVISRPTTSIVLYSQMLGRALRGPKMGGTAEENVLVDIIDNYSGFGTERATFDFFDEFYNS